MFPALSANADNSPGIVTVPPCFWCYFTAGAAKVEEASQEHHAQEFLERTEYTDGGHAGHTTTPARRETPKP